MRYLFEEYAFDTDRRELHRGAEVVAIAPQVFDLLEYLIRNRERVVSKDELVNAVWNGRIVSDAALTTRLNSVRVAIGDTGEEQRIIKTLQRKGFRFVAQVQEARKVADPNPHDAPETPLALPHKPSIAVLPFENMSGDPEQDYFADGMVEDIITALSRFKALFVIARNSSFIYKGRSIDVKQIGRELGVRYVLEGSIRKSAKRVRITGQLVDTTTGAHIWADRFDAALEDIFDLQDKLSTLIVGAISPKLEEAEIERAKRKPTESLHAYDYYLRGKASFHHGSKKSVAEALELFKKASQIDPAFAAAYAMAAWCYDILSPWTAHEDEAREAVRLARRAARLGTDDATALSASGFVLASIAGDFDAGMALTSRALVLNPNLVTAWFLGGWVRMINGEPDVAIELFAHAERLSPFDPLIWAVHGGIAGAHFFAGRYDLALSAAERCLRDMPNHLWALAIVAASSALTGATDRAREAIARGLKISPGLSISEAEKRMRRRRSEDIARMREGFRKAGLPE
ncbi:winged helix-turn-helix domain-containing tetratricopeptide repeat protein [Bradyrhizobium centrosematis]|uniref:winged helix-turn-helix domain-containing tetratricopeptide repeat protein n=1 Tax=Bradyrhizobium centrosematis TaxID=1300039 RepID=UPI002168FD6F|nr:winged helix-turn-helix domain-containing protein [Bradyrhizobium centrosematis]MCS3763098.1 TolB-like protein [Bradyrhizobium centrosematis]MCS3775765.1 TolB-like protein [Bradyrhizobium centrosematis]